MANTYRHELCLLSNQEPLNINGLCKMKFGQDIEHLENEFCSVFHSLLADSN